MKNNRRKVIGKWGEQLALQVLKDKGYQIVGQNVRTSYGEIDLIVSDKNTIIFVEVKTRSINSYGYPEESITKNKYLHLHESALSYIQEHPERSEDWRIDVIAIEGDESKPNPKITWFENVFA